jgi:predicted nucleic acid-binding protein
MMRIYLDNCCFNRPFDDQRQIRIKLEAEAKLYIQEKIRRKEFELVWSYILDHENQANPFGERKRAIQQWKHLTVVDVSETPEILEKAEHVKRRTLKSKDALHIACAIWAKCDAFLTTDDHILKKFQDFDEISVISPLTFMTSLEENDDH